MEIFFYIGHSSILIVAIGINIYFHNCLKRRLDTLQNVQTRIWNVLSDEAESLDATKRRLEHLSRNIDQNVLDLQKLQSTKPNRPNNWDSVKEAFKGPVRDERN